MSTKLVGFLVFIVMTTSILAVAMGNKDVGGSWAEAPGSIDYFGGPGGYNWAMCQKTSPNEFVVGGSKNWQFGYNYSAWAINMCMNFHVKDILVFKYDPPVAGRFFNHSVYLLNDFTSYQNCSFKGAKKIGEVDAGGGEGFKFELQQRPFGQPYFFACGERNGLHCNLGLMKFAVSPWPNW